MMKKLVSMMTKLTAAGLVATLVVATVMTIVFLTQTYSDISLTMHNIKTEVSRVFFMRLFVGYLQVLLAMGI